MSINEITGLAISILQQMGLLPILQALVIFLVAVYIFRTFIDK